MTGVWLVCLLDCRAQNNGLHAFVQLYDTCSCQSGEGFQRACRGPENGYRDRDRFAGGMPRDRGTGRAERDRGADYASRDRGERTSGRDHRSSGGYREDRDRNGYRDDRYGFGSRDRDSGYGGVKRDRGDDRGGYGDRGHSFMENRGAPGPPGPPRASYGDRERDYDRDRDVKRSRYDNGKPRYSSEYVGSRDRGERGGDRGGYRR
jgi:23S rRNA pseudouridine2605 synthase